MTVTAGIAAAIGFVAVMVLYGELARIADALATLASIERDRNDRELVRGQDVPPDTSPSKLRPVR